MNKDFMAATPGPWQWDEHRCRVVSAETHDEINHLGSDESVNANGRLQAAAPTFLRLLTSILRDLPTRRDWLDPDLEREARKLVGL